MRRHIFYFLVSIALMHQAAAQQKKVCFTIDDLPVVNYGKADITVDKEITTKLIASFNKYAIPAIGYVNERKLYSDRNLDDMKVALLKIWLEGGYELGNHTYSHPSYHKVSYDAFINDLIAGEKVTKPLAEGYGSKYHYFRHPYLHIGKTKESADSLSMFLSEQGYVESPVTIDPDDYLFAKKYHVALINGEQEVAKKVAQLYLDHIERKILYYENVSVALFDRNMNHTLLLHANLLNADYLDEMAEIFQKHNYHFVSQTDVLEDKAYQTEITKYGPWGISWLDRWALSLGKAYVIKNDPQVPDFIKK